MESTSAKTNRTITMDNLPKSMESRDLREFCSRFGKVISITRSTSDETRAVIEFNKTDFLDLDYFDHYFPSTPFTPAHDLLGSVQNGQFLSNVLNSYNSLANISDENRNVASFTDNKVKDDSFDCEYLICTYCYCCAEFQCARCQSPYCSEKCQSLDWLSHKKTCSPKPQAQNKHAMKNI